MVCTLEDAPLVDEVLRQQLWKQASRSPERTLWIWLPEREPGDRLLVCTGRENGDLLVLKLDAASLGKAVFLKQKITDRQIGFLLDGSGRVIFADSSLPEGLVENCLMQYRAGRRSFSLNLQGRTYDCYVQYNGLVGWTTWVAVDRAALFPQAASLQNYLVLLVLICVTAAALWLMLLSRKITKPLRELNNGMKQVYGGNFEVRLENHRTDEIGELTDTFNYMVNEIQVLINQVYREQLAQKTAELQALQAQINPHFLYNSLDSINWMLIDREELDISRVVVALGKLMQYSMDTSASLVPLREEYRNVRDYMVVQHNRLEDKLDYTLELEPGLEEQPVPKLILQPLVENAIKHGVLNARRSCLVAVWTGRRENRIVITVRDNGAGMDRETLEACRRSLSAPESSQKSIGLPNVARRLQLHYGGLRRISLESQVGMGTEIRLELPFREEGGTEVEADPHR